MEHGACGAVFSGCASIVSRSEYEVPIHSNAPTSVEIRNRGAHVTTVNAPTTITLSSKSTFFVPSNYTFTFKREGDDLPGDELAGSLQRFFRSHFESAAAWNLHAHDGDGLDVVLAQDFRQLLRVVHGIELRTADDRHLTAHELLMEVRVGVGRAVGGDEQLRALEERRAHRNKPYLAGPL